MFCNHYLSFDLSLEGHFNEFKKEMYTMNLEYGKPQSKFIVGCESNFLKGGVCSESK